MNEDDWKQLGIRLTLTIPALIIGILSAFAFILKPVIELWFPEKTPPIQEIIVEDPPTPHQFH
jgi:hypothetical protein